MPNTTTPAPSKGTLTLLTLVMTVATVIYPAITFIMPPQDAPPPPMAGMVPVLYGVGVALFGAGFLIEAALLSRAQSPGAVQTAGIVSAAMGEAVSVLGLVAFFLTGHRHWFLFGLGLAYMVLLLLRLPRFFEAMGRTGGGS